MHCSVVSDVGPVVDAVLEKETFRRSSLEGDMISDVYYLCEAHPVPIPQKIFHYTDVLPYGFQSVSDVFSVVGRHTNKGIIFSSKDDKVWVIPVSAFPSLAFGRELVNGNKVLDSSFLSRTAAQSQSKGELETIVNFFEAARHFSSENFVEESVDLESNSTSILKDLIACELYELDLLPSLHDECRFPPYRVGTHVLSRRFGAWQTLHCAEIAQVQYDCTYTVKYKDGGVDFGVLHRDVFPIDSDFTELCTVRDNVVVSLQRQQPAKIVECKGGGVYRATLMDEPDTIVEILQEHIVYVTPLLCDALFSSEEIVNWFRKLDSNETGSVAWKDVRHLLLNMESFGEPLSFAKIGALQRDLCLINGRMEPQLLSKIPVQEEEMRLSFKEFEFVLLKVMNEM